MTARFLVSGRVQGVGFRWFVRQRAHAAGLRGWARNLADGRVEVVASGTADQLDSLEAALRAGPPGAAVAAVVREPAADPSGSGFEIR